MSDKNIKIEPLLGDGQKWQHSYEQPISYAPLVQLANNNWIVPQHFLRYKHTLASVNEVLNDISFSTHFSVLAAKKNSDIYLQVAVLSPDNYCAENKAKKLLFGRRWPVEQNLPTSELIQTAFLALKVAREHEVRELFQLQHQGATSTPFNNHHDLPVMAQNPELVKSTSFKNIPLNDLIERLVFADNKIALINCQAIITGEQVYTVKLHCDSCQLSEFNNKTLSFLAPDATTNSFLHSFIAALVAVSNEYVSEHFKYPPKPQNPYFLIFGLVVVKPNAQIKIYIINKFKLQILIKKNELYQIRRPKQRATNDHVSNGNSLQPKQV